MEIFALIFVCSIYSGDCVTIHDRSGLYETLQQCEADYNNLKNVYNTDLIYCVKGDILEDHYQPPISL